MLGNYEYIKDHFNIYLTVVFNIIPHYTLDNSRGGKCLYNL